MYKTEHCCIDNSIPEDFLSLLFYFPVDLSVVAQFSSFIIRPNASKILVFQGNEINCDL